MIVNSDQVLDEAEIAPDERLLDALRERLGLTGTKEACGRGECGACTVLVDGEPVLACITLAARVRDSSIETIEGLAGEVEDLAAAFADLGGFQCGFCTPGQLVRGAALLRLGLPATEGELRLSMSGNICRCTGYNGIVAALRRTEAERGVAR